MPPYIDGFVLPVRKDRMPEYIALAETASRIWKEHGALEYRECAGEDLAIPGMLSFSTIAGASEEETVVFAYIVYQSREHRDEVNAKVMADPRLKCSLESAPFDCRKMAYSGFTTVVEA